MTERTAKRRRKGRRHRARHSNKYRFSISDLPKYSITPRQVQNLFADKVQNHLATHRCDARHKALPEIPFHVIFHSIAHPAVAHQSPLARSECGLGRQVLCAITCDPNGMLGDSALFATLILQPFRVIGRQLDRLEIHVRICQGMRNCLVLPNWPSKHDPLLGISGGFLERGIAKS